MFREGFLEEVMIELRFEGWLKDVGGKVVWEDMEGLVKNFFWRENIIIKEFVVRNSKNL